jgi:uncharacterized protein (DUF1778 family)
MTPSSYTGRVERTPKQEAAMLAHTGKRLTTVLTRRESLRLLELIENPPPRNEKFLQAMNRYQGMKNNNLSTTE